MIGLPTETLEDVLAIDELGQKVVDAFYQNKDKPKGKGVEVSLSAAAFVPKPFTPFQWFGQDTMETLQEKQYALKGGVPVPGNSPSATTGQKPAFWRLCLPEATGASAR